MANRLMTRADHRIISVCEAGVENLIKNGNARKKIVVIHNAVDPLAWKPGADYPDIRAETRKKYGIADKDTVFFCASRFAHDKGHKFFIESLSRLADLYGVDHMRVLLAGDGPLEADAVARVEACGLSGTVIFTGFAVDIKPLFYAADVYVNPSEHEALSFLILEALASGLPVIATDMGGNGEIVNERNKCGALIEYGDVTALCRAIQAFRTNNAYLLDRKANALATIQNKFALSEMLAKSFASFY
jgi:glycosyltransferase involved in cell wall biosynthesis